MYRYITFGPKTNLAEHETYETLQGTFVIDFLSFKVIEILLHGLPYIPR